jgi:D-glycero-D-manno-heptose 1,7-bisphosphate phosphatase
MRPALLLDRDGVINIDRTYVSCIEAFEWQPGIFDLARAAIDRGMAIVVVTNQSGIGRGYYTEDDYQRVTAHMRARFEAERAPIAAVYHCPFHPEAETPHYRCPDHPWRKPRPGMILAARDDLDLDLTRSILIGDRWSDIAAGAAAGVGMLVVIGDPAGAQPDGMTAHFRRFATVSNAAQWLANLPLPVSST